MAFLRFSRDKRWYEHFQLVEPMTRKGKTRTRVLYEFRTPHGIKVGREPFDEPTRRALEKQYPAVAFDWKRIVETPIPSADAEKWRERRREEKAAKRAKKAREADGKVPEVLEVSEVSEVPDVSDVSDVPQYADPPDPDDDSGV